MRLFYLTLIPWDDSQPSEVLLSTSYGMRTLVMIMAGGVGSRLWPLTAERAKPAVYFAGKYRIIDFVVNNFINSGFYKIKVLTQFKSDSLNRHITTSWNLNRSLGHYVDLVPAQMRTGDTWYKGTADAIHQNINLISDERPEFVAVFGGDHIYKMEINQLVKFHSQKKSVATVAAIPVPVDEATEFGVIEVDAEGRMIGFEEKPENPKEIPGRPGWALASMGNYVFNSSFLVKELREDASSESSHDFGKDILPKIYKDHPVYVYDFSQNRVPDEGASTIGFWKDVGTLDAYFEANMDICSVSPQFNLYNLSWPLRTYNWNLPPAKFVFADGNENRRGEAIDSVICDGSIISGGHVERCVISPNVTIHSFSKVTESILLPDVEVHRGAKIKRAIIEKGVIIPEDFEVGYNLEEDRKRFHVTDSGIVIVPKHTILS